MSSTLLLCCSVYDAGEKRSNWRATHTKPLSHYVFLPSCDVICVPFSFLGLGEALYLTLFRSHVYCVYA